MVVRILTRFGLISLCSKNWRMTFLRYSRFTSSSARDSFVGDAAPDGRSEFDEIDVRLSVAFASLDAQYPAPGFLCFSSNAAED